MKKLPSVTVAIFHYNGLKDTVRCLKALQKTKYPNFSISVIDDGSVQDDMSVLKSKFKSKKISYYRDGENKGFSMRANQALKDCKSKYVMLLNNDTVVTPNWLNPLVDVMESNNKIAVCQSKLLWLSHPKYFEYSGACGGYLDKLGLSYARGRVLFDLEKDVGQYEDLADIFWASGAAMLIRRNVTNKVGWFDEDLHSYQEEVDFCWRLRKLGKKIKIVPKSVIYHKGSGSWGKQLSKKIYLVHRNSLALLIKHLSPTDLVWVLPLRVILDYGILLYYVLEGRLNYPIAVVRSHLAILVFFPFWFSKRSVGQDAPRTPFSIIWQRYFRQKNTYAQLLTQKTKGVHTIGYQKLFRQQEKLSA